MQQTKSPKRTIPMAERVPNQNPNHFETQLNTILWSHFISADSLQKRYTSIQRSQIANFLNKKDTCGAVIAWSHVNSKCDEKYSWYLAWNSGQTHVYRQLSTPKALSYGHKNCERSSHPRGKPTNLRHHCAPAKAHATRYTFASKKWRRRITSEVASQLQKNAKHWKLPAHIASLWIHFGQNDDICCKLLLRTKDYASHHLNLKH